MSWAKQNKFLAGYWAVFGLLFLVIAVIVFLAYSNASESSEARIKADQELTSLQSASPFPNEANLEDAKSRLEQDQTAADDLLAKIKEKYNFPLPDVTAGAWAQDLNTRLDGVKSSASVNDVKLYDGFFLGMRAYAGGVQPKPELLPELSFQVHAIDALVSQLVSSGVTNLKFMDRDKLEGEPGYKPPATSKKKGSYGKSLQSSKNSGDIKSYTIEMLFETAAKGRGLDNFLSRIASHPKFFYTIRILRIENELQLPPSAGDSDLRMTPEEKKMVEEAVKSDNPVFPKIRIQGREKLNVYVVLDILRFEEDKKTSANSGNTTPGA